MLEVRRINKKLREYEKVTEIYKKSFPENEKLPIWLLNIMSKRRCVDFLAFYDENIFCGFTYLITNKNTTFVLYLAIDDSIRSKGYGSQILNWIVNNKQNNIVLNIETVSDEYDNYEQRVSRQKFYLKNGFVDTKYKIVDKNDVYDVLHKGDDFSKSEYEQLFRDFSFGVIRQKLSK